MNKLRGTRSTGCKGKAGKEGGSKQGANRDRQGQTKKPKAEAEEDGGGQMGQRTEKNGENAGNTGNTGNTGNAGNRRWKQKRQEMYTGNAQYKKKTAESLPQSFVFCSPSSGAASGILPYSAGCSAGVSAGACAGISAWGIVAGASVSRTRS